MTIKFPLPLFYNKTDETSMTNIGIQEDDYSASSMCSH